MAPSYSFSPGFAELLAELDVSIAFSTQQSGLLYLVGRGPDGPHIHKSALPSPTGLFAERPGELMLATGAHVLALRDARAPDDLFDARYVERSALPVGDLDIHDLAIDASDRPIFVSTRCNCLATTSRDRGFELIWKPPFVTAWRAGDKVHVNGFAMADGRPAYVTLWSRRDSLGAWREHYGLGGLLMDARTDEIVLDDLCLPHSPRLRGGELWLLNSGAGELGIVEGLGGPAPRFQARAFLAGFPRGLALHGAHAFVGVSRPRPDRLERLPRPERFQNLDLEPGVSVRVIELATGRCVGWMRGKGEVAEIYDVAVLPGVRRPTMGAAG